MWWNIKLGTFQYHQLTQQGHVHSDGVTPMRPMQDKWYSKGQLEHLIILSLPLPAQLAQFWMHAAMVRGFFDLVLMVLSIPAAAPLWSTFEGLLYSYYGCILLGLGSGVEIRNVTCSMWMSSSMPVREGVSARMDAHDTWGAAAPELDAPDDSIPMESKSVRLYMRFLYNS